MSLVLSYSVQDDKLYEAKGYKFLGAAKDKNGSEVHVWEVVPLTT